LERLICIRSFLFAASGILTFINPFATATALVFLAACWALVIGIGEIAMAISLRRQIRGEGWYIVAGILTFLFGLMVNS